MYAVSLFQCFTLTNGKLHALVLSTLSSVLSYELSSKPHVQWNIYN